MKVTVLIPTLNPNVDFLQKAMDSIPRNVDELVICSEFGSKLVLADFALPDLPVLKIFRNRAYTGLTGTINEAVSDLCSGDWVSILPDDDFYGAEIESIVEKVKDSPAEVVYFPSVHIVNGVSEPTQYDNDPDITFEKNLQRNQITGSAFFRRKTFEYLGGYHGEICMDWDLWNRALKSEVLFEYIDKVGLHFRIHDGSRLQILARGRGAEIKDAVIRNAMAWDKKIYSRCPIGGGL